MYSLYKCNLQGEIMARGEISVTVTRKHLAGLNKALIYFGTQTSMAKALDLTRQAVSNWYQGRLVIPERHATRLSNMTQGRVSVDDLRPDLIKVKNNDKKYLQLQ
jgi:DNA-binding transcriptional regulator YdaS (Cro superfamily)